MNNWIGEKMNKGELVNTIAEKLNATKAEVARMIEAFSTLVTETLKEGEQIVMPGFGTFAVVNRSARTGRNPQTGEAIEIKASRVVKFKPSKSLKEAVQES